MHVVGCLALVTASEEPREGAFVTRSEGDGEEPCSTALLLEAAVPRASRATLLQAVWAQALATTALLASAVTILLLLAKEATRQPAPPTALFVAVGLMSLIAHATDLLIGVVILVVRAIRVRRVHGCGPLPRTNL